MEYKIRTCRACRKQFQPKAARLPFCSTQCRFWSFVNIGTPTDCWEWKAGKRNEYGCFGPPAGKGSRYAHRWAWDLSHPGDEAGDLDVLHKCDNPPCCNPSHLYLGTHQDNMTDMHTKHRRTAARGEDGTNKLTEDDVRAIRQDSRINRLVAADYGVVRTTISAVKNRKTWTHI